MRLRRGRSGVALRAIPLVCAGVGLLVALMGQGLSDGGQTDARRSSPPASDSSIFDEARRWGGDIQHEGPQAPGASPPSGVSRSSRDSFLEDLDRTEGVGADRGAAFVSWKEAADLPVAAEGVLRAYERTGVAAPVTSGYMDLSGNIWGAVMRMGASSCDMVLVVGDGAQSEVRVTRIRPDGAP